MSPITSSRSGSLVLAPIRLDGDTVDLLRHALDLVHAAGNGHDRNSGNLSYSSLQVLVIGANYVASMLLDARMDTVVCIDALVLASQPFEARILRQAQSQPVSRAHFLKLSHYTISDARNAFR